MAVPSENVISPSLNDPVTKAVVDNIMGNLPTKKPHVRCDDCDLSFTSQTVLDAHLQGARHAKQIRSKNIMATLEGTKVPFTKDEETNGLRCNVCSVRLNSIQQLQTHLNGTRHKKKALKGDWRNRDKTLPRKPKPVPSHLLVRPKNENVQEPSGSAIAVSYSCNLCDKAFNSTFQYNVHLTSRKHMTKLNILKKRKGKGYFPYWLKKKPKPNAKGYIQALSNNFVPGGVTDQL